jgi:prevent-host-death family protein
MATVNVSEAKATLSELVERVLKGEEITIGRRGKAEVRLVAVQRSAAARPLGVIEVADYWMSDDFDAPLEDIAEDFDPA